MHTVIRMFTLQVLSAPPPSAAFSQAGVPLHQSDKVISRKSEILLVSDVCISLSIPIHPQYPPLRLPPPQRYPT